MLITNFADNIIFTFLCNRKKSTELTEIENH
jgi:hypothetical protein